MNLAVNYFTLFLFQQNSNILNDIAFFLSYNQFHYNTPFAVVQSIALFLLFGTFQFKNRFVNRIASLMLGVYLIHELKPLTTILYSWTGIYTGEMIYGKSIILHVFLITLSIFIVSAVIEWLRQFLFKLCSKLKWVQKLDLKCTRWCHNMMDI